MKVISLFTLLLSSTALLVAAFRHGHLQSALSGLQSDANRYPAQVFTQKLDHFDPYSTRTFAQRFWVNEDFFDKEKPDEGIMILYISGESEAKGPPTNASAVGVYASRHKGLIVTIEHRYYGKSIPCKDGLCTTAELQWLNSKQALNDLAVFRDHIQSKYNGGRRNKWLVVGGSYSGALSAWFRLKYPHLADAAISSSGVVNAVLDFQQFDQQVAMSAGPECAEVLRRVTMRSEEAWADADQRAALIARFSNRTFTEAEFTQGDFHFFVADSIVIAIQYGFKQVLCSPIVEAYKKGGDEAAYQAWITHVLNYFLSRRRAVTLEEYSTVYQSNPRVDPAFSDRLWWYQTCTEFGYWQTSPVSGSNPPAIRSSYLNLDYYRQHCQDVFGIGSWPDTNATNLYYGGANIHATNVYYVNGVQDPWQHASVLKDLSSTQPAIVIECEGCAHCVDLHSPSPDDDPRLAKAREQVWAKLDEWLSKSDDQPIVDYRYSTAVIVLGALVGLLLLILASLSYLLYQRTKSINSAGQSSCQSKKGVCMARAVDEMVQPLVQP